jgi:hypothetical protein
MDDAGLAPLSPWTTGGWVWATPGYYIHHNRVYLQGEVSNFSIVSGVYTPHAVSATVLNITDPTLRPSASAHATVAVYHYMIATAGVASVGTVGVTIGTDGAITLDSLPASITSAPDGTLKYIGYTNAPSVGPGTFLATPVPDFGAPVYTRIVMGNVSWPVGPAVADTWTSESLAPYLDPDGWEDVDARIGQHTSRVHLSGRIRARHNIALAGGTGGLSLEYVSTTLPAHYTTGIVSGACASVPTSRLADKLELTIGSASIQVTNDVGWEQPDSLAGSPTPGYALPMEPPGGWPPTPTTITSPGPGSVYVEDYPVVGGAGRSLFAGLTTFPTGWPGGTDGFTNGIMDINGGRTVTPHFAPFSDEDTAHDPMVAAGQAYIYRSFVGKFWPALDHEVIATVLATNDPMLTVNAMFPPPDWVAIYVNWTAAADGTVIPANINWAGDGHLVDSFNRPVSAIGGGNGWLSHSSGGTRYDGDPFNAASVALLWKPTELPTAWQVTATMTIEPAHGGTIGPPPTSFWYDQSGKVIFDLIPVCFYRNERDDYILAGDTIDLTGVGWQAPYTAPVGPPPLTLIPTQVVAGAQASGSVRSMKVIGSVLQKQFGNQTKFSLSSLVQLAVLVGFGSNSPIAASIAMAESSGDPLNQGFNAGPPVSVDRGLWQINSYYHPEVSDACAYNPVCCCQQAYRISSGGTDWTPWSTYSGGEYSAYITEAEAIYAALGPGSASVSSASSGIVPRA